VDQQEIKQDRRDDKRDDKQDRRDDKRDKREASGASTAPVSNISRPKQGPL
jgi:hypothetical protein